MLCPYCSSKTQIYNSRGTQQHSQTWRRRRCTICKRTFTTRERVDWDGTVAVASSETTTNYSRERLLLSVLRASNGLTLPIGAVTNLCDSIENQLQHDLFFHTSPQESVKITEAAITVLRRYDPNLALQYVNATYHNKPPVELLKRLLEA